MDNQRPASPSRHRADSSIAITVAAFGRARAEGVDVRQFGAIASGVGGQAKTDHGGEATPTASAASGSGEGVLPPSSEPPSGDRPTAESQPET